MPRILVAEDDPDLLALCISVLEAEGYDVLGARDGGEALKRLFAGRFDTVLLDIIMPIKDGITVCRELRGDPRTKHMPIIVMSTSSDALSLAAPYTDTMISKPFDIDSLLYVVSRVIGEASEDS